MQLLKFMQLLSTRALLGATLSAGLGTGAAQAQAQAQAQTQTLAQRWDFNDVEGTALNSAASSVAAGSTWNANIANTLTEGSGNLRIAYNSTAVASSFAPLNVVDAGVLFGSIVVKDWHLKNGATSGSSRPIFNFGFRSAASNSSSLVADVQFTATTTGVTMVVRDSASDFATTTLPLKLGGPLSVTLKVDGTVSPSTYLLSYAILGGASGSYSGSLSATSSARTITHVNLQVSGNHPGSTNVAPLIDQISVNYNEAPVTIAPPANGRPGKPSNLISFLSGNPVQSTRAPVGGPAVLLMGGGTEVNAAFTARAYPVVNAGDIVVLRTAGGNGYQSYLYSELVAQLPPELQASLQPNSVETLIVDSRSKANNDYVAQAVSRANLIWIAGGDQSQYIDFWRGTALANAVKAAHRRGAVIGGTSAGMVVAGEWMYDPGANLAVTSAEAVADPYRSSVILNNSDLFGMAQGFNLIAEPHFANRDRMGRLLTFMARLRQDARSSLIYGVGLDEGSSLFIDANKLGEFQRQAGSTGSGYILAEDRRRTQRVQVSKGLPLIYRKVQRVKLTPGQRYDFARGLSTQPGTVINVEGVLPANPY